jgi:hypothetical protein
MIILSPSIVVFKLLVLVKGNAVGIVDVSWLRYEDHELFVGHCSHLGNKRLGDVDHSIKFLVDLFFFSCHLWVKLQEFVALNVPDFELLHQTTSVTGMTLLVEQLGDVLPQVIFD